MNKLFLSIMALGLFIGIERQIFIGALSVNKASGIGDAIGSFAVANLCLVVLLIVCGAIIKWLVLSSKRWYEWVCTE